MSETITMVKKRLANGEACNKCEQAEAMLKKRGLWERIDNIVWASETDPDSEGNQLARKYGMELAPFFLVDDGMEMTPYPSVLKLVKQVLENGEATLLPKAAEFDLEKIREEVKTAEPPEIVRLALSYFGERCGLAFSGAEDVAMIDMAAKTGLPFSVFSLDTGRLHAEAYRCIEKVRTHYGIEIEVSFPRAVDVEALVKRKGLFSFYEDGHQQCCQIRKVAPLRRALRDCLAWMTGQRRDQSPTRAAVERVSWDLTHGGVGEVAKFNPLADWSLEQTWAYIRENDVPYNPLHDQGFVSIGCEPCTRAIRPGEHERAGRWWWEEATQRECGLHAK
jgi:phosphoadenosine phosphosulfate reductase